MGRASSAPIWKILAVGENSVSISPRAPALCRMRGFDEVRGANQGRRRVQWESRPCDALNGLRDALQIPRRERHSCVQQIASTLHLRHLPTFFERVTAKKSE